MLMLSAAAVDDTDSCTTRLHYFDIRGRGEAIRMAMHDQGIEFVDSSFTQEEWGRDRPDGLKTSWTNAGKLAFGQVPLLEIDGLTLVQSHTILRYLGRRHGWYEGTPEALAKIDVVADGTEDVRKRLSAIKYSDKTDAEKTDAYARYFTSPAEAELWLGYLEKLVGASMTEFAASTPGPSHADYLLLDLLDFHESVDTPASAAILATMPALTAWRRRMLARPRLSAYLGGPGRRTG